MRNSFLIPRLKVLFAYCGIRCCAQQGLQCAADSDCNFREGRPICALQPYTQTCCSCASAGYNWSAGGCTCKENPSDCRIWGPKETENAKECFLKCQNTRGCHAIEGYWNPQSSFICTLFKFGATGDGNAASSKTCYHVARLHAECGRVDHTNPKYPNCDLAPHVYCCPMHDGRWNDCCNVRPPYPLGDVLFWSLFGVIILFLATFLTFFCIFVNTKTHQTENCCKSMASNSGFIDDLHNSGNHVAARQNFTKETHEFRGEMGIVCDDEGIVQKACGKSQAFKDGIRRWHRIVNVNGNAFSKEGLTLAEKSESKYTVNVRFWLPEWPYFAVGGRPSNEKIQGWIKAAVRKSGARHYERVERISKRVFDEMQNRDGAPEKSSVSGPAFLWVVYGFVLLWTLCIFTPLWVMCVSSCPKGAAFVRTPKIMYPPVIIVIVVNALIESKALTFMLPMYFFAADGNFKMFSQKIDFTKGPFFLWRLTMAFCSAASQLSIGMNANFLGKSLAMENCDHSPLYERVWKERQQGALLGIIAKKMFSYDLTIANEAYLLWLLMLLQPIYAWMYVKPQGKQARQNFWCGNFDQVYNINPREMKIDCNEGGVVSKVTVDEPAHAEGIMKGQKIVKVDNGKYAQATHTFEPGAMGLEYDANGTVKEVFDGNGQAFAKGVVKGEQILKVGTDFFSPDAVHRAETNGHQYHVTFKVSTSKQLANAIEHASENGTEYTVMVESEKTDFAVTLRKDQTMSGALSIMADVTYMYSINFLDHIIASKVERDLNDVHQNQATAVKHGKSLLSLLERQLTRGIFQILLSGVMQGAFMLHLQIALAALEYMTGADFPLRTFFAILLNIAKLSFKIYTEGRRCRLCGKLLKKLTVKYKAALESTQDLAKDYRRRLTRAKILFVVHILGILVYVMSLLYIFFKMYGLLVCPLGFIEVTAGCLGFNASTVGAATGLLIDLTA